MRKDNDDFLKCQAAQAPSVQGLLKQSGLSLNKI